MDCAPRPRLVAAYSISFVVALRRSRSLQFPTEVEQPGTRAGKCFQTGQAVSMSLYALSRNPSIEVGHDKHRKDDWPAETHHLPKSPRCLHGRSCTDGSDGIASCQASSLPVPGALPKPEQKRSCGTKKHHTARTFGRRAWRAVCCHC